MTASAWWRRGAPAKVRPRPRLSALLIDLRPGPWSRPAITLVTVVCVLVGLGLVTSFSASMVTAAQQGSAFGELSRQLVWVMIGLPLFLLVASTNPQVWRRLSWPLLVVAVLGLVLVLVPGVGVGGAETGSNRWLRIGVIRAQPSELAKLAALLWLADVLERKRPSDGSAFTLDHLLIPALPLLGVLGILVMAEPDLGTTVLLAGIIGLVLFVEGLPLRSLGILGGAGLLGGALLATQAAYRSDRIRGWLFPESDPEHTGWQLIQSWTALGSGGLTGRGLGASRGAWNFVPNPHTDFIFAIIGEELGFLGAVATLTLFAVVVAVGLRVAEQARSGFTRTVAFGVTGWIGGQALLNVMTVVGLLPITGVTLPLVSAGGSSLVTTLVALGILVAIARENAAEETAPTVLATGSEPGQVVPLRRPPQPPPAGAA